jgi:hypothetical protein
MHFFSYLADFTRRPLLLTHSSAAAVYLSVSIFLYAKRKEKKSSSDTLFSILRSLRLRFTERSPTRGDGIESFLTYKTKK